MNDNKLLKYLYIFLELNPVLVVGAGLSAADAVTICRLSGIKVIHVYRNRSAGLDKMLPETVYPEYHEVRNRMEKPLRGPEERSFESVCFIFLFFSHSGAQNDERLR